MKIEDSFVEIGELLRSQKPGIEHSPGLEQRILRAITQTQPPPQARRWIWLALPVAFAAIVILFWKIPEANRPEISRHDPPAAPPVSTSITFPEMHNPLDSERNALSRDVKRAGNFLIDCLPSLAVAD